MSCIGGALSVTLPLSIQTARASSYGPLSLTVPIVTFQKVSSVHPPNWISMAYIIERFYGLNCLDLAASLLVLTKTVKADCYFRNGMRAPSQ